jgi:hypothetical protein
MGGTAMKPSLKILNNKFLSKLILVVLAGSILCAKEKNANIWSAGSAYVLPQKRIEIGLFQPLRYGYSTHIEWSVHPLLFFIMPNFSIKWSHGFSKDFTFATRHSLYYPTLLLRTISREGTGGIISPEFEIPHMLAFNNEILISREIGNGYLITGKTGISLATKFGSLDERTTIDLPMVYNRLLVFYHGYQLRFGVEMQGKIYGKWRLLLDGDYFYIPGVEHNKAFEHKGLILWHISDQTEISLGYKLNYGEYPYGSQWHLLLPIFDIQKAWHRD